MINDLIPILFKLISSWSPRILWGIIILEINGLIKAVKTVAVEWNPKLPVNRSIKNPIVNA